MHRADDLVVAGAAAEVAGQPVAHLGLGRVRVLVEQRLGRDQEARACRCRTAARRSRGTSAAAGAACRPCAMPSMVSIVLPSASTPSTRQEQTRRPSTVTVQAPQSPEPQPSLLPVRPSSSRSTSSSVCVGVAEELDRLAVDGGGDVMLRHGQCPFLARASAAMAAARFSSTPGDLGAVVDGAALVVDRLAGGAAGGGRPSPARRRRASSRPAPWRRPRPAARSARRRRGRRAPRCRCRPRSVRLTPQPTTAMSISVRGIKRR